MSTQFDDLLGGSPAAAVPPTRQMVPGGVGGERSMGAFDGASRFDQATEFWQPQLASADADIIPEMALGDARARDMLRNDSYVSGGATLHKDNIVGAQYVLNAKPSSRVLFGKQDDVWETEMQEEVEEIFDLVSDSPENYFDAARMNTFTGIIRLGVGVHLAGGEILSTAEWIKNGRPFNTAIQMVDKDRLSTPPLQLLDGSIRAGVRGHPIYKYPLSYFIRSVHPNDYLPTFQNLTSMWTWKEVPKATKWGRVQVLHLLEQMRPDQTRGIAAMVSALKEMRITRKFRDVTLQNAVTQALYAAAITSERPPAEAYQMLGAGGVPATPEQIQEMTTNWMVGYFNTINDFCGGSKNLHVDGVRIPHLPPGTKLDMLSPGKGGPLGMEFEASLLRYIAATLGVSYEQLSRDYTKTNYSSARAAMAETWKFMQSLKKQVADRYATMIYRLWLEEMVNANRFTTFPKKKAGLLYENNALGLRFDALSRCDWIGAARGQIDELKETQAAVLKINNGLSTREDEIARLGGDWRKKLRQQAREAQFIDDIEKKLGRPLFDTAASAAMMNATEGGAVPTNSPKADGEGDN